jgi:putative transcriptional regulator
VFVSHAGNLLVATPLLTDPNFFRSVVLLIQHDAQGTVGLVLNRPTEALVRDHLPDWTTATGDGFVFSGGPVEPEVAIALAVTTSGLATGVSGLSMVDMTHAPDPDMGAVRIYSGYAGWDAEQLESELEIGSWYIAQASPDDPFGAPGSMWREVLRRQGGHLGIVSTYPDDAQLN